MIHLSIIKKVQEMPRVPFFLCQMKPIILQLHCQLLLHASLATNFRVTIFTPHTWMFALKCLKPFHFGGYKVRPYLNPLNPQCHSAQVRVRQAKRA